MKAIIREVTKPIEAPRRWWLAAHGPAYAEIQILSGDKPIATDIADANGQFVVLPPGSGVRRSVNREDCW
jgi:hypothetical protein